MSQFYSRAFLKSHVKAAAELCNVCFDSLVKWLACSANMIAVLLYYIGVVIGVTPNELHYDEEHRFS